MIGVELRKLCRRPRTWVSIGLLCALPIVVAIFLAATKIGPGPGQQPAFLSAVLSNGALYPAAALALVLPLFLPVAVAIVGGDAIAGEASAGMLRYLLVRPVHRGQLLVAKLLSMIVFVMLGVGAVALFLSTMTDSSLAATLGALAALVASQVLVTLDAAGSVRPYLPTRYWLAWIDLFREPILWRDINRGLA